MLTQSLVHSNCEIEAGMHKDISSALSSSMEVPRDSANSKKMLGIQDIERQDRKRKTTNVGGFESQLGDRNQIGSPSLGLSPCKQPGWHGRHFKNKLAWVLGDSKPAKPMTDEIHLRNQEALLSLKNIFEEVAGEQDEWAKLRDPSH